MNDRFASTRARNARRFGSSLPFRMVMFPCSAVYLTIGLAMLVGVPISVAKPGGEEVGAGDLLAIVGSALFMLALSAACLIFARSAVIVSSEGIETRQLVRSRHLTWSDIEAVEIREVVDSEGVSYWPRLTLRSGEHVDLTAASSPNGEVSSQAVRATSAISEGLMDHLR